MSNNTLERMAYSLIENSEDAYNSEDGDEEMGSRPLLYSGNILITKPSFLLPVRFDLDFVRVVFAEMVGTFLLIFCVCGIIASAQQLRVEIGLLENAATSGSIVAVVIYCIGSISGAHINPAITIAFATSGHFPWSKVPFYILAQTSGSILATYFGAEIVFGIDPNLMITTPVQSWASAFWVELIATFIIMFLVSALTYQGRWIGHLSGVVVGICIGLAVLIAAPISGGSMNPARSLGPAIVAWKFSYVWVYLCGPTLGAVAGALLFQVLRLRRQPSSITSSLHSLLHG